jgi:LacI family transcriptional regulator
LLRGIAKYSRLHGPWGFSRISEFYWQPGHIRKKTELGILKGWNATGIITREMDIVNELLDLGIPVIGMEAEIPMPENLPYITSNYEKTGQMAADYFLNKGFRNFAYCGFSDTRWSRERLKGFRRAIEAAGYTVATYEKPMAKVRKLWKDESGLIAKWLLSLPAPTGLMACSDDRSQHVLEASKIAGLHVPEKLAIIGTDNDELLCELSDPTLSSIAFNLEKTGYEAAKLLDKLMDGEPMAGQKIIAQPTSVITRQSTDILAIEDAEVTAAVRYIREHAKEMIQVRDVVAAVSVSRRILEQRFRKILNRSILDEIKRVHIEQVAQMLVETTFSIKTITLALGHHGVENISRYFKHFTGLSPSEFRKQYGEKN